MKRLPLYLVSMSMFILFACSKEPNYSNENRASFETSLLKQKELPQPINFTETNLFPEGVVYDRYNDRFYVSSTTRGDIGIVTRDGDYTAFITDPTLVATTGLEIDETTKRLYVSNAPNGVGVYDINTGERIFYADLAALIPGAPIFINDITIDPQGNAYVTNSQYPVIYKISRSGEASIFYYEPALALPTGQFGFNGIEYSNSGFLLVAYTSVNSIIKIPVSEPTAYSMVTLDQTLSRPDGLLLSSNGQQLTVVNNAGGAEGKVLSFTSNDKWQSGTLDGSYSTGSVFPTTATSDGKNVWVIYAYLNLRASGHNDFTIQPIPNQ